MKFVKGLSLILALIILCSALFACDNGDGGDIDVNLPEREFYEVKVSFQVKDSTGKTVIEAIDYNYKGHAEPTILNVLDTYLAVVKDWVCKIKVDEEVGTKQITQIGGMKVDAKNGEYWGIVSNLTTVKDEDGKETPALKKNAEGNTLSALNLSLEEIKKQMNDEASMDKVVLIDGAEFTVIQIVIGND